MKLYIVFQQPSNPNHLYDRFIHVYIKEEDAKTLVRRLGVMYYYKEVTAD